MAYIVLSIFACNNKFVIYGFIQFHRKRTSTHFLTHGALYLVRGEETTVSLSYSVHEDKFFISAVRND